jgi:hypothetical protein
MKVVRNMRGMRTHLSDGTFEASVAIFELGLAAMRAGQIAKPSLSKGGMRALNYFLTHDGPHWNPTEDKRAALNPRKNEENARGGE